MKATKFTTHAQYHVTCGVPGERLQVAGMRYRTYIKLGCINAINFCIAGTEEYLDVIGKKTKRNFKCYGNPAVSTVLSLPPCEGR